MTWLKLVRLSLVLGCEAPQSWVGAEHRPWYFLPLGDQLSDHLVVGPQALFLLQLVQQLEGSLGNLYARCHTYTPWYITITIKNKPSVEMNLLRGHAILCTREPISKLP